MKFNKISTVLSGAFLLLGAYACTDEVEYNPAPAVTGAEVYFSNDESADVAITADATSVSINLHRYKTEGELTVGLTSSIADADGNPIEGIFSVPTEVVFPDGAGVVPIEVGVVFGDVVPAADYMLTLSINGEDTTPYGLTSRTFALSYSPWTPFKRYGGKDEYGTVTVSGFGISGQKTAVYISESIVKPEEKYQFGDYDCYDLQEDEKQWTWSVNGYNFTVTRSTKPISADYPNLYECTMEPCPTGDTESVGSMIMITDAYTYLSEINPAALPEGSTAEDYRYAGVYDSKTGLFEIFAVYYVSSGFLLQSYEYFQLPGFANYTLEFNYTGNYVDTKGNELAVVQAYKSDDVNSFAYTLRSGKLSDDEAEAVAEELAADTDVELNYESTSNLSFSLSEDGDYTIVGVGYDESGKHVVTTAYTFGYASVQVNNPWQSLGLVEYTDGFFCAFIKEEYCGETLDVELLKSKDTPGLYRLKEPYMEWSVNQEYEYSVIQSGSYIEFNIQNPDCVYITDSPLGYYVSDYGMSYGYSYAALMLENGYSQQDVIDAGRAGKYEDGVITFPTATLFVYFDEDPKEGLYYANTDPKNTTDDPEWGTGTFCIDMSFVADGQAMAPKKRVAAKAASGMIAASSLLSDSKPFVSNLKLRNRTAATRPGKISGMELLKNSSKLNQKLRLR